MADIIYVDGCVCENCKPLDPKKRLRWKNCSFLPFKIEGIGTGLGAVLFFPEESLPKLIEKIERSKAQEILVAMNRDCLFLMREKPDSDENSRIREVRIILQEAARIIRTKIRGPKITGVCWSGSQNLHLGTDPAS